MVFSDKGILYNHKKSYNYMQQHGSISQNQVKEDGLTQKMCMILWELKKRQNKSIG